MPNKIECVYGVDEIDLVAKRVVEHLKFPICVLSGELGAGKTTLLKSILNQLSVVDQVNSPTYSIVNEYRTHQNDRIYHFDL